MSVWNEADGTTVELVYPNKCIRTVLQWCDIFGIELIDNDGFTDVNSLVSLNMFLSGIVICTIRPINKDKYSVLNALI